MNLNPVYIPWLGRLNPIKDSRDGYRLEIPHFAGWTFNVSSDLYLVFCYRGMQSPLPFCSSYPVKAIQTKSFTKDPFAAEKHSPVTPSQVGWYWSPILGWCCRRRDRLLRIAGPALQRYLNEHPQETIPSLHEEDPLMADLVHLWDKRKIDEIISRSPFFHRPQTFALHPL